jgi:AcrR family transcriptional regulator
VTDAASLRLRILHVAEQQLSASQEHDISTRAVCEAVGVGQPTLYRVFGDKAGLLAALVDHGFDRYVQRKRALEKTDDAIADLRAGWDDHIAFAVENPAIYRLMFAPTLTRQPKAPQVIFDMLSAALERCARDGALRLPAPLAAQRILSANIGVALAILVRPDIYTDPLLSAAVRDAVFAACLDVLAPAATESGIAPVAIRLAAQLRDAPPSDLGQEERHLLLKWLGQLGGQVTTVRAVAGA